MNKPINIESKLKNSLVVIVDDVVEGINITSIILRSQGFTVQAVTGGEELLQMLETTIPDLILMDLAMPMMNGIEVCHRLQQNPKTKSIPVIFLTVHSEKEHIIDAFQAGAVDFVSKPVDFSELVLRVRAHLELKYSRELLIQQNEELQALQQEKDKFIGLVVNELKNPLAGISAFAQYVRDTPDVDEQERATMLDRIVHSTNDVIVLINDLLRLNRLNQQEIVPVIQACNSAFLISQIAESCNLKFQALSLQPQNNLVDVAPVSGDELLLTYIFDTVLAVQMAFAKAHSEILMNNEEQSGVVLTQIIATATRLMPAEVIQIMGQRVPISVPAMRGSNSSAIGLNVAKHFAELMSGTLHYELSDSGGVFTITLPVYTEK